METFPPFFLKKVSILKKGLCGDPNLDMLFCAKKELKIFDLGGMRKICKKRAIFGPHLMNISSKRSDIELKILS